MKVKLHRNQREALLYAIPPILTRSLSFFLLPIYSRVLSPGEFGLVSIALVISGVLQMVVLPGLEGLYLRYGFQGYSDLNLKVSPFISTLTRAHLFLSFVALPLFGGLAILVSSQFSPDVPASFIWLALGRLALESLQSPLVARFKASRTVKKLALFELCQVVLTGLSILTCLFVFELGPISLLLGEALSALFLFPLVLKEAIGNLRVASWEKSAFRIMAKSFVAVGPEAIFYWALTATDRYFLNYFQGAAITGIYVAGYQFASLVASLVGIGVRQWRVILYQAYVDKTYTQKALKTLYQESFCLFFILSALIAVSAESIAGFALGGQFQDARTVIPIVMLIACFRVPMAFFSMYGWAKQMRRKVVLWNFIALFIFLAALVGAVPFYGLKGAAWSGFFGCFVFTVALQRIPEFKFDSSYFRPDLLIATLGLAFALVGNGPRIINYFLAGLLGVFLMIQVKSYFSKLGSLEIQKVA